MAVLYYCIWSRLAIGLYPMLPSFVSQPDSARRTSTQSNNPTSPVTISVLTGILPASMLIHTYLTASLFVVLIDKIRPFDWHATLACPLRHRATS